MEEKLKKLTRLGAYLKRIGAKAIKIKEATNVAPKNISLLSTNEKRTIYADEFYKIIYAAHQQTGLGENEFNIAIDEIFPDRVRVNLLEEFDDYSSEGKFFKKYTQQQSEIENKLGIPSAKISKYFGDNEKRALAIEIITFAESIGLNVLQTFIEIYGSIKIVNNSLPAPHIINDRTNKVFEYITAYNSKNTDSMVLDFADNVVFLNIMNGEKIMELRGIEELKKQAIEALSYFSERQQSIETMTHKYNSTEIVISYRAIAAIDFPNGLKKGDEIKLKGKSVFEFSADGKIIRLTDIS
ncbi:MULTISPECIES: nuclear transport factor 2 family protein [Sphingobacterium]|uniref:nuclear transport factor 2 family protein n=1 Tax=Sphingobacterium TaxID=28453 RepID=UPI00257A92B4|nr:MULTISPECIES: nuclear transport factor 2 family protein [Sphingobacterium]